MHKRTRNCSAIWPSPCGRQFRANCGSCRASTCGLLDDFANDHSEKQRTPRFLEEPYDRYQRQSLILTSQVPVLHSLATVINPADSRRFRQGSAASLPSCVQLSRSNEAREVPGRAHYHRAAAPDSEISVPNLGSSVSRHEGRMDRADPVVLGHIPDDKVGVELPVRPAPAERLCGACKVGSVADARLDIRLVVSAEFAQ